MHNLEGMEISNSLQHLSDDIAGVSLRIITLIQDPVKHLPARGPVVRERHSKSLRE